MSVTIPIRSIDLRQGSAIAIHSLSWNDCEDILNELGEDRSTRIAYHNGTLEIMSPLARHERPHRITGDIVKVLLDMRSQDWEDFGSTTFYRKGIAGVEPDTCFYVANSALVRDCQERVDVDIYPPPDLAIESDVTSKTLLSAYEAIAVPEIWIYRDRSLKIFVLADGHYQESEQSLLFPDLSIKTLIPQLVDRAIAIGTSGMLREFRQHLTSR
ncbi:Putative restriction endonuclease domain-containing protein [Tumidithrix helvetica PCC 7403]|uniref:Uma2 family endonuclease n=1 Tax=Tumidithrix helvetica TaxID=3457545 RepID=UPI003C98AED8